MHARTPPWKRSSGRPTKTASPAYPSAWTKSSTSIPLAKPHRKPPCHNHRPVLDAYLETPLQMGCAARISGLDRGEFLSIAVADATILACSSSTIRIDGATFPTPKPLDLRSCRRDYPYLLHQFLRVHFSMRLPVSMEWRRGALQHSRSRNAPLPMVQLWHDGICAGGDRNHGCPARRQLAADAPALDSAACGRRRRIPPCRRGDRRDLRIVLGILGLRLNWSYAHPSVQR